jgi:beta-glucanase (GH16 family)
MAFPIKWLTTVLTIVLVAFAFTTKVSDATTPDLSGYKLIFDDEFDGESIDLSKWQIGTNPSGQQWGSDSYFVTTQPQDAAIFPQVYIQHEGILTIRANYQADFVDRTNWGRKWYSGMITTAFSDRRPPSAVFRRGYVEIRQKFPSGKGVWPGNWAVNLQSQTARGDPLGTIELDGLEAYGVDMTIFHSTMQEWRDKKVARFDAATAKNLPDLTRDFHTYGYLVDDSDVKIYFDGIPKNTLPLYRPDTIDKFFWMFNLAMGGGWPIDIPATGHYDMQIDYIRIYSKDPDASAINN